MLLSFLSPHCIHTHTPCKSAIHHIQQSRCCNGNHRQTHIVYLGSVAYESYPQGRHDIGQHHVPPAPTACYRSCNASARAMLFAPPSLLTRHFCASRLHCHPLSLWPSTFCERFREVLSSSCQFQGERIIAENIVIHYLPLRWWRTQFGASSTRLYVRLYIRQCIFP